MNDMATTLDQPAVDKQEVVEGNAPAAMTKDEMAVEVLAALEQVNVSTPEQIRNMAHASSQAGNIAQKLGEEREARRQAEARIEALERATQNQPRYESDAYGNPEPASMTMEDVTKAAESAVRNVMTKEFIEPQEQAQKKQMQDIQAIQSDPDYKMVENIWRQYVQNPNVSQRIQSGQTDYKMEYDHVVKNYFKQVMMKSKEVIQQFMPIPDANTAPHVETGSQNYVATETPTDDNTGKIKNLKDPKTWRGTEEQMDEFVALTLKGL